MKEVEQFSKEQMDSLLLVEKRLTECVNEVVREVTWAIANYPEFASSHEGLAIVQEEFHEFRDDVYNNRIAEARVEAKQLAAMAIRYMLIDPNRPDKNGKKPR